MPTKPFLNESDLQSILLYCAYLRNVYDLPHRTLHEFDWFVSAMIWGSLGSTSEQSVKNEEDEIHERWGHVYCEDGPDALLNYGKAFLQYCRGVYEG